MKPLLFSRGKNCLIIDVYKRQMESNIIVSEAVEDFVDPEAETTTEA